MNLLCGKGLLIYLSVHVSWRRFSDFFSDFINELDSISGFALVSPLGSLRSIRINDRQGVHSCTVVQSFLIIHSKGQKDRQTLISKIINL